MSRVRQCRFVWRAAVNPHDSQQQIRRRDLPTAVEAADSGDFVGLTASLPFQPRSPGDLRDKIFILAVLPHRIPFGAIAKRREVP